VHIINGIHHEERVRHVARQLVYEKRQFGVIMEAPANLQVGVKRLVKAALGPIVTPIRTWGVARKAEFVLSASGNRVHDFRALGFHPSTIFPFGYFPDYPLLDRAVPREVQALRILCIGYLEPFKGQDCLLKALAILRKRGVPFECSITGFGSAREKLIKMNQALGLDDKVSFTGVVSNERLAELFRESNVLVAPGLEEPWGIRVNEALLSGLPVVVSDGVGARELIATSGAGEIFRANSQRSLADKLEKVLRRLQRGSELGDTVRNFRPTITPSAAADFLEEIIRLAESPPRHAAGPAHLTPLWLNPDWRQVVQTERIPGRS
jgi:glycosyltransferase involved in cell wall biosynthesis